MHASLSLMLHVPCTACSMSCITHHAASLCAMQVDNAHHAASLSIAEQYLRAFSSLAKEGNTLLLPSNVGDPAGMVGQALGIFNTLSQRGPFSKPSGCAPGSESKIFILHEAGSTAPVRLLPDACRQLLLLLLIIAVSAYLSWMSAERLLPAAKERVPDDLPAQVGAIWCFPELSSRQSWRHSSITRAQQQQRQLSSSILA